MSKGKLASLGGLLAAAVLGVSLPACAEPLLHNFTPFGARGAANPPVARYLAGNLSFILDRSEIAPQALLKYDDMPEVWVLQPSPAPGGATIYRNDVGQPVVRVTRLGGVTLFTLREPEGVPAALVSEAEDLMPPPFLPENALLPRSALASDRISRLAQHGVTFQLVNFTPATAPLFLDAITITSDAIVKLGRRKDAKLFLAKLEKVVILPGAQADVSFSGSVLTVTVVPSKGYAGRPSSDRIAKAALKR